MKISELIKELEEFKAKHGDLVVVSKEDGMGGYGMLLSEGISKYPDTINGYHFEDIDDEQNIKKVFPEWDGNEDTLDDLEVKVAILYTGDTLYST